jgi:hypothetical protein
MAKLFLLDKPSTNGINSDEYIALPAGQRARYRLF